MIGCLEHGESVFAQALLHSSTHPFIHPSTLHIARLLALQAKVDEHTQAITRLKTIWSLVAAGIAFLAATLKAWLFGQK